MSIGDTLAIEAVGLEKRFKETRAVNGVDLAVRGGSVYGVLGPNGAGKTTTIRMLATLLRPDGGSARVLGHDIVTEAEQVRRKVSLTGQLASVDEDLTGRENLVMIGRLLGLRHAPAKARAAELLGAFGLEEAAGRLTKTYSGGMRRRLDIAGIIDRALRDEGTSYHYMPASEFADADPQIVQAASIATSKAGPRVIVGSTWTTDAPFRETAEAIEAARTRGILGVEMEAAALYAFASSANVRLLCLAHVTNTMGQDGADFEKGEADGARDALSVLSSVIECGLQD